MFNGFRVAAGEGEKFWRGMVGMVAQLCECTNAIDYPLKNGQNGTFYGGMYIPQPILLSININKIQYIKKDFPSIKGLPCPRHSAGS